MIEYVTNSLLNDKDGVQLLADKLNEKIIESNCKQLDIVVGYFNVGGFYKILNKLPHHCKIRILVGMGRDNTGLTKRQIEKLRLPKNYKSTFKSLVAKDIAKIQDDVKMVHGAAKLNYLIEDGRVQIKATNKDINVHAKVYLVQGDEKCFTVSGSSNFTTSGLMYNIEFNTIEDRCASDVINWYNELWNNGVKLVESKNDTLIDGTWLDENLDVSIEDTILKLILENYREEINANVIDTSHLAGVKTLKYQIDAVKRASYILDRYNGVFLADVVGLGKTYMGAMLLKSKGFRYSVIIAKDNLIPHWKEAVERLGVTGCNVIKYGDVHKNESVMAAAQCVIVDESQNYRNTNNNYKALAKCLYGKKVVLISATPQNNSIKDIENQLMLFTNMYNSNIMVNSGDKNLRKYFKRKYSILSKAKNGDIDAIINKLKRERVAKGIDTPTTEDVEEYAFLNGCVNSSEIYNYFNKKFSDEVRQDILANVMVRRTRKDIENNYKADLDRQGIVFPKVEPPITIGYQYGSGVAEDTFDILIENIKELKMARYKMVDYLKTEDKVIDQTKYLSGVMRCTMMKRLDSSFQALRVYLDNMRVNFSRCLLNIEDGRYESIVSEKDKLEDVRFMDIDNKKTYRKEDLQDQFFIDVRSDIATIDRMVEAIDNLIGSDTNYDPKIAALVGKLKTGYAGAKNSKGIPLRDCKIIIFTESAVTSKYLEDEMKKQWPDKASKILAIDSTNVKSNMNRIKDNLTISSTGNADDLDILITTDIFSEGINLQIANVIINYDIPWNPTKLIQRAGRINRIDSLHDRLYVYNMDIDGKVRKDLRSDANIISKLNAFKVALGDDIKYLAEQEDIDIETLFEASKREESYSDKDFSSELMLKAKIDDIIYNNREKYEYLCNLPPRLNVNIQVTGNKAKGGFRECSIVLVRDGIRKCLYRYYKDTKTAEEITLARADEILSSYIDASGIYTKPGVRPKLMYEARNHCINMFNESIESFVEAGVDDKNERTKHQEFVTALDRLYTTGYVDKVLDDAALELLDTIINKVKYGDFNDIIVEYVYEGYKQYIESYNRTPDDVFNWIKTYIYDTYININTTDKKVSVKDVNVLLSVNLLRNFEDELVEDMLNDIGMYM